MSDEPSKGWILHSHAQGRKFGPLTEDELRNYFRAGMVKSVDRLTAPGETGMHAAADVAAALGETVPVGPPPPEASETAAPSPSPATSMPLGTAKDPAAEERAARAMAAMNIDFAALAASSTPGKRQSSWLLPAVVVVALVAMMFVGLGMLRRMSAHSAGSAVPGEQAELAGVNPAIARPPGGSNTPLDAPMPGAQAIQAENPAEAGSDPADAEFHARFQRANALQEAGDWSGLVEHAKAWAAAQPDRMEPQHFLGIAYSRLGQHDAAAEALTKVLQHDPTQEGARNLLADTFLQAQRWPEAAAIYKQLVVQKPDNSRIWNNYGAALVGLGEKEQAVAALETAVRLDPSFKQAWQNLGTLYQQTGDQAKASAAFANAH